MVSIYFHLNREQAELYSLILSSAGIGSHVAASDDGFFIEVPKSYVDKAADAIRLYEAENPASIEEKPVGDHRRLTSTQFSGVAVAILLLAVHIAVVTSAAPKDYIDVFGAESLLILRGEVYRCATALVLHADAAHIAGNMVGLAIFGGAVSSIMGAGLGWLMILACGVLGNWVNAFVYETSHLSVGASTSVFGAVGILCAIQAVMAKRTGKGWKQMGLALAGGFGLLAFLGTGPGSDLGAHLFGFTVGLIMGSAFGLGVERLPGKKIQWMCGTFAIFTLFSSWIVGITS